MDNRSTIVQVPLTASVMDHDITVDDDESLEQRIRRLENAIAALSDTSLMEDRVLQRVKTEIEPPPKVSPTALAAIDLLPREAKIGFSMMDNLSRALRPSSWLLLDILRDVKDGFSMYFDSRYRKTITFQMMFPMLLGGFIFSQFLLSSFIGKFIDIFIVLIGYKVLMREIDRYRELIGPLEESH